ncbi:23S rRNA (guanosine(2251)-2'-O)-methyltransferase RlmB [Actinoallomurus acaciae]|uniref:23S rRNA (Guanosine(2251)-2'-O)-methyltransferase RlmB n=1 Tax=Actinoallomurus acaciae TaxID=502577 RepID=A0ABV5YP41_9ACTN
MAKRRKKGSSHTPKAEDRHWYGKRQTARAAKSATRTGTATTGSRRESATATADRPPRRSAPEGPELVTGRNPVVEALRAGIPASTLYVMTGAADDRIRESIKLATNAGVPLLETGKAELDRLTDRAVHQGIALQVPEYDYAHPDDLLHRGSPTLIVALDGVTDPRNLGAVVRSAAAFGAHGVLVPERRAAGVTAGAWKTSAGTLASVPVARATNLVRTLKAYQKAGLFVAGLDARGANGIDSLDAATGPLVLVVGSEGKGLSRLVAETCDLLVNIPMPGRAESLNAGVAGGIALYEIARHRAS